jgi:hypothetical protein
VLLPSRGETGTTVTCPYAGINKCNKPEMANKNSSSNIHTIKNGSHTEVHTKHRTGKILFRVYVGTTTGFILKLEGVQ